MVFIFVVLLSMAYLMIGGISHAKIQKVSRPKCRFYPSRCDSDCSHSWLAGCSNILWPVIIPILFGQLIGERDRVPRAVRRQEKERAEAEHKIELARLEAERIRVMERKAGIR